MSGKTENAMQPMTNEAVKLAETILGTWSFQQIEAIKDALNEAYRSGHKAGFIEGFSK